jgi:hypothetical protein
VSGRVRAYVRADQGELGRVRASYHVRACQSGLRRVWI